MTTLALWLYVWSVFRVAAVPHAAWRAAKTAWEMGIW
jgi:hypothetical protein